MVLCVFLLAHEGLRAVQTGYFGHKLLGDVHRRLSSLPFTVAIFFILWRYNCVLSLFTQQLLLLLVLTCVHGRWETICWCRPIGRFQHYHCWFWLLLFDTFLGFCPCNWFSWIVLLSTAFPQELGLRSCPFQTRVLLRLRLVRLIQVNRRKLLKLSDLAAFKGGLGKVLLICKTTLTVFKPLCRVVAPDQVEYFNQLVSLLVQVSHRLPKKLPCLVWNLLQCVIYLQPQSARKC